MEWKHKIDILWWYTIYIYIYIYRERERERERERGNGRELVKERWIQRKRNGIDMITRNEDIGILCDPCTNISSYWKLEAKKLDTFLRVGGYIFDKFDQKYQNSAYAFCRFFLDFYTTIDNVF